MFYEVIIFDIKKSQDHKVVIRKDLDTGFFIINIYFDFRILILYGSIIS